MVAAIDVYESRENEPHTLTSRYYQIVHLMHYNVE